MSQWMKIKFDRAPLSYYRISFFEKTQTSLNFPKEENVSHSKRSDNIWAWLKIKFPMKFELSPVPVVQT